MGRTIIACIDDTPGVEVAGGTESAGHPSVGSDLGELAGIGKNGVLLVDDLDSAVKACDVVIDFTTPASSMETLRAAVEQGRPVVLGTTGFSKEQKQQIRDWMQQSRCVMAPNMSIGVNVLFKLVREAASVLGEAYDVEIVEAHHKFKKDAPRRHRGAHL